MKPATKAILVVVGLCVMCCCGGPLLLWFSFRSSPSGLAAGIAAYHKAGLPWTADEIRPPVTPDQDGGPQLEVALQKLADLKAADGAQSISDALQAGRTSSAEKALDKFKAPLALVEAALQRPHAVFAKDWDLGPAVLFPEMGQAKAAVKLLAYRATVEAKEGQVGASDEDLLAGWNLSARIGEEPILIGLLVQIAGRNIVMRQVEQCCAAYVGRAAPLRALDETVTKMNQPLDVVQTFRGEAYMGLNIVRNLQYYGPRLRELSGDEPSSGPPLDPRVLRRTGNPNGLYAELLGGEVLLHLARASAAARKDRGDLMRLRSDFEALDEETEKGGTVSMALVDILAPPYKGTCDALLRETAQTRTTKALIQALIIKAETGHYPKSVSDLPTKWIDPYDGTSLGMRVVENTIRFYTLGPDLKDHGGKTAAETGNANEYDIVAGYPVPNRTLPRKAPPSPAGGL